MSTKHLGHIHNIVENHTRTSAYRQNLPITGPLQLLNLAIVGFDGDLVGLEFLLGSQGYDFDSVETADGQLHPGFTDGHVLHVHVEESRGVQGFCFVVVAG